MNKKATLALALVCLLAVAAAILFLMDEILFINSSKVESKPGKLDKTSSGTHDSESAFFCPHCRRRSAARHYQPANPMKTHGNLSVWILTGYQISLDQT